MAIDTKPNLSCCKFEQCSADYLYLSGCTDVYGEMGVRPTGIIDSHSGYRVSGTSFFNAGNGSVITAVRIGQTACANTLGAIAIGAFSKANTAYGVAIGYQACATSSGNIAIGNSACATGSTSIYIGGGAAVCGAQNTVIGINASAKGISTVIGTNANACSSGIAVGVGASAALASVTIGTNANASGSYGIGVGYGVVSTAADSIGIGHNSCVISINGIGIGCLACATQTNATAIGGGSKAFGLNSIAIGCLACADNTCALVIGAGANATGVESIAIGSNTISNNASTIAIGTGANASGFGGTAIAIGHNTLASGYESVALGCCTKAEGTYGIALGGGACACGSSSLAVGHNTRACASETIAVGYQSTVCSGADYSIIAGGHSARAGSMFSYVGGYFACTANAVAQCSVAIGLYAKASGNTSTVIGGAFNTSCGTYGTILGGRENVIGASNTSATIINGYQVKLTGATTYNSQVIVPNLTIWCTPSGSGNVLCWDSTTKKVGVTSVSGIGAITGATNLGSGNGTIYTSVSANKIQLKTLSGGTNITLTCNGNYIGINAAGGSSASGERITKLINQASHGFSCGTVIGWSGGTYNKAIANDTYNGEILGIVSKCYNTSCFDLTQAGYVSGLTSLSANTTYFLSDVTPGLLTTAEPSTSGYLVKAVLIANSSTSGWVLPYPGYLVTSGTTVGIVNADNGLTADGVTVCLGGTLINNTNVAIGNKTLCFSDSYFSKNNVWLALSGTCSYFDMGRTGANAYVDMWAKGGPEICMDGATNRICTTGAVILNTTPAIGACTDSVLVWNSGDKLIKKVPYISGSTSLSEFTITGNSSSTGFTINHAKNKQFVMVEVVKNSSPYPTVYTNVERTNANCICITFDTAPATGQQYKILIIN